MAVSHRRYHLLRTPLRRFARTLPKLTAADPEAIHRARVASRRLREVLPVLGLDPRTSARLRRRLRAITRALGPVREQDVLRVLIEELHESGRFPAVALDHLRQHVMAARSRAATPLLDRKFAAELTRTSARLTTIAAELKRPGRANRDTPAMTDRTLRWVVEARVARRAEALRRAIVSAGNVYLPERLHQVRIALKKLRYGLELASRVTEVNGDAALLLLRRVQRLLGRMHDLQMLLGPVRQVQVELDARESARHREFDELIIALDRSCRRLHARYVRERDGLLALTITVESRQGGRRRRVRPAAPHGTARGAGRSTSNTIRRAG